MPINLAGDQESIEVNKAEYYECVLLADWLDRRGVFFTHFPAGEDRGHRQYIHKRTGRMIRYSPAGKKLQRMGLRKSVSDYLIFDPPPAFPGFVGAVFEMKAKKEDGGKPPTKEQLEFLAEMRKRGYKAQWGYGGDTAIDWFKILGY